MTEPTRLSEMDAGDLRARLVRSAARDAPERGAHARAAVALGVVSSLGAGTATAAQSATKSLVSMLVKWTGIGVVAGTLTSGIVTQSIDRFGSAPKPTTSSVAIAAPPVDEKPQPASAPAPPVETATATPSSVAGARVTASPAAPSASAETKPSDSLADELAMLDRAREALAAGNPGGAITALDRYRSTYPKARLGDESTLLRIEALIAMGNRSEAVALGDRFLSQNGKSPLSQRVRTLINR